MHWTKVYDARPGKGDVWQLDGTGYYVRHCGHPTANWPWYGLRPDGSMILAPTGRAFRFLNEAKAATAQEAVDAASAGSRRTSR